VPVPLTPLAVLVILLRAVLPSVCEVVEAGVEHGLWNVQGCQGIVEDAWLKAAEGIGMGKGPQGVLFLPLCVVVQFLEIGQVLGQVSDSVVGTSEALYFSTKGFVSLLSDGEVDHWGECCSQEKGICLFTGEDSLGIWVFSCPEWVRVTGAVVPS
jgi:hypothetical protein